MYLRQPEVSPWVLQLYPGELICECGTSARSCPVDCITFNLGSLRASSHTAYDAMSGIRAPKKSFGLNSEGRIKKAHKDKQIIKERKASSCRKKLWRKSSCCMGFNWSELGSQGRQTVISWKAGIITIGTVLLLRFSSSVYTSTQCRHTHKI